MEEVKITTKELLDKLEAKFEKEFKDTKHPEKFAGAFMIGSFRGFIKAVIADDKANEIYNNIKGIFEDHE